MAEIGEYGNLTSRLIKTGNSVISWATVSYRGRCPCLCTVVAPACSHTLYSIVMMFCTVTPCGLAVDTNVGRNILSPSSSLQSTDLASIRWEAHCSHFCAHVVWVSNNAGRMNFRVAFFITSHHRHHHHHHQTRRIITCQLCVTVELCHRNYADSIMRSHMCGNVQKVPLPLVMISKNIPEKLKYTRCIIRGAFNIF